MAAKRNTPAKTVDEYLANVPPGQRTALRKLRKIIQAAAPKATEVISYQMPGYKHGGYLVGFAAFKDHCSFFVGTALVNAHKAELEGFDTTKGGIHFTPERPLPAALVRKIVKARIAQNEGRAKK